MGAGGMDFLFGPLRNEIAESIRVRCRSMRSLGNSGLTGRFPPQDEPITQY